MTRTTDHLRDHGHFSGSYIRYRYGEKKPSQITLPIISALPPPTKLRGGKRQHVVSLVMDALKDWRLSPFENEGPVRAGLRSYLCLRGMGWQPADTEAAGLVESGLSSMGAQRPSWLEGQREYLVPQENCSWCTTPIPDEFMPSSEHRSFCSDVCARAALQHRDFETRHHADEMYQSAWRIIQRGKNHTRICKGCEKAFRPMFPGTRFCTHECASIAAIELKPIDCRNCGKTYQPRNRYSVYCGRECSAEGRVSTPARKCLHCDKVFHRPIGTAAGRGKFCSRGCADAHRSVLRIAKVCKCCGQDFQASSPKAEFCTNLCGKIVSKIRIGRPPKQITPPLFDYIVRMAA